MINMLKSDLYKLFHRKGIWLCLLITCIWGFVGSYVRFSTSEMRGFESIEAMGAFWDSFMGYHPITLPLVAFLSIQLSEDFQDRTIKLYFAKGISKVSYYISKCICSYMITGLVSLAAILMGVICNCIFFANSGLDSHYAQNIFVFFLGQWIGSCAVASFVMIVAFCVRKPTVSISINWFCMIFGYAILNKLEAMTETGNVISTNWAYSVPTLVEFGSTIGYGQIILVVLSYTFVCGLLSVILLKNIDIE